MIALLIVAAAAAAEDWPNWRGPRWDGVSLEESWTVEERGELWRRQVGLGHSASSIRGGQLYTLGFDEERGVDVVHCLDAATGETVWTQSYPGTLRNESHGGGTLSTPAVTAQHVFVTSSAGEVRCLDASSGEVRWKRDLARELGTEPTVYGFGGSPLVIDDLVFVNVSKTAALRPDTGETVWQSRDHFALYSTPAPFVLGERPCVAVFTREGLTVLDRGEGAERFAFPWRKGEVTVNAATPVVVGEQLFVSSGYEHGCALVEFPAEGARSVWESRVMRTRLSGCVLVGGHLYGFDESTLKCVGLDGKERWRKRGLGLGALSAAGTRLLVLGEEGEFVVAAANPERYEELHRRHIFEDGNCWSNPVLSDGLVFLRSSRGELVCLDQRAKGAESAAR